MKSRSQSKNYRLPQKKIPQQRPLEKISSPFQRSYSPQLFTQNATQNIQFQTMVNPVQQPMIVNPVGNIQRSSSSMSLQNFSPTRVQQQSLPVYTQQSPTSQRGQFLLPPSPPRSLERTTSHSPPRSRVVARNVKPPMLQQQQQAQNLIYSKVQTGGQSGVTMMGGSKIFSQPPQPVQLQAVPSTTSVQQQSFVIPGTQIKPGPKIMNFQQPPVMQKSPSQVTYIQPPLSPPTRMANNNNFIFQQDPIKENKIKELEQQNRSLLQIIQNLENKDQPIINTISSDLQLLQEQLTYYQTELTSKDQQVSKWKAQCESMKNSQNSYSAQIADLQTSLANSKLTIQSLTARLNESGSNQASTYEISVLQEKIKKYEIQISKQNDDIVYLRNYTQKYENSNLNSEELKSLRQEKNRIQDQYKRSEQNYKTEIQAYEKEIKRLKEQHKKEIEYIRSTMDNDDGRETVKRTGHYKPKQHTQVISSTSYSNDYTEQPPMRDSQNLKHSQFQHGSYQSYSKNDEAQKKILRTYIRRSDVGDQNDSEGSSLRQSSTSKRSKLDRSLYNTTMRAAN